MKNLIKGIAVAGLVVGLVSPEVSMAQNAKARKANLSIAKSGAGCHHSHYKRKKPKLKKVKNQKDSFDAKEIEEHVIVKEIDGKKSEKVVSKEDYDAFEKMPQGTDAEIAAKTAFWDKAKALK